MGAEEYAPGTTLADRYRIIEPLSKGAMGAVYRAEQIALGREVAVKVILPRYAGSKKLRERFDREARLVCRLQHPNLVTYHDYGRTSSGAPFLVMELLRGYPGSGLLRRRPPLASGDVGHVIAQLVAALSAAHGAGIIHRDLKWANVMVCPQPDDPLQIKLIDFGIAKQALGGDGGGGERTLTRTNEFIGTPAYVSPEQVRGQTVDGRSDLYSLGVMVYELLTGSLPFSARTSADLLDAHLNEAPRPMSLTGMSYALPSLTESVVMRALEKSPRRRYRSVADFGRAFAASLRSIQARPGEDGRTASRARLADASRMATAIDFVSTERTGSYHRDRAVRTAGRSAGWSTTSVARGLRSAWAAAREPLWQVPRFVWAGVGLLAIALLAVVLSSMGDGGGAETEADAQKAAVATAPEEVPAPVAPAPAAAPDTAVTPEANEADEGWPAAEAPGEAASDVPEANETDTGTQDDAREAPSDEVSAPTKPKRAHARRGMGYLSVSARPYAQVTIDRRSYGQSPVVKAPFAAGRHTVVLSSTEHGKVKHTVTVKKGKVILLQVDMSGGSKLIESAADGG